MVLLWSLSTFDWHIINFFILDLKGDLYLNTLVLNFTPLVAIFLSSLIFKYTSLKKSFMLLFLISAFGSGALLYTETERPWPNALLILASKFGFSGALNLCLLATAYLFPAKFSAIAFGITNTFSKIALIFAPIFAQFPEPFPLFCFSMVAFLCVIFVTFLEDKPIIKKMNSGSSFIYEQEKVEDELNK